MTQTGELALVNQLAAKALRETDPGLAELIAREEDYQRTTSRLIASETYVSSAVLAATGSMLANK